MDVLPKSRRYRWLLGLVAISTLFIISVSLGAVGLGRWLVVSDPLKPARAVVVLGGGLPFRAMEAATIYHQGWAPEVWVSQDTAPSEEAALRRLGIHVVGEETYDIEVLKRMGVPPGSIRLLPEPARNTAEEELAIAQQLRRTGGGRIIIVTSKPHTRRARATWHVLVGDTPQVIIQPATEEPYEASHWWQNTRDALAVTREFFGLLNIWAGFPCRPNRRQDQRQVSKW